MKLTPLLSLAPLLLLAACTSSPYADSGQYSTLPGMAVLQSASECRAALSRPATAADGDGLAADSLELLSWNIYKTRRQDWHRDLASLSLGKQLVFLQEATESLLHNPLLPRYGSLAPGYQQGATSTGVATFASVAPDVTCHLQFAEPLLRLPKAIQVNRYDLAGRTESLLVANVHLHPFSLDNQLFANQLDQLMQALSVHTGPLIVAGDFNTWNSGRYRLLTERLQTLGASPVRFADDQRSRVIGATVDHVFTAGLTVESSATHRTASSDHNPVSVRLRF